MLAVEIWKKVLKYICLTSQALKGLARRKVTKGPQQKHVKISRDKAIEPGGFRAARLETSGWSQMWKTVSICKATFGSYSLLTFCFMDRRMHTKGFNLEHIPFLRCKMQETLLEHTAVPPWCKSCWFFKHPVVIWALLSRENSKIPGNSTTQYHFCK